MKSPSSVKKIAVYLKKAFTLFINYLGVLTLIAAQYFVPFDHLQYIIKLHSSRNVGLNQKYASAIRNIVSFNFLTFLNRRKEKLIVSSLEEKDIYTTGHIFSINIA